MDNAERLRAAIEAAGGKVARDGWALIEGDDWQGDEDDEEADETYIDVERCRSLASDVRVFVVVVPSDE